ncbi:MAG: hypothetical protein EBV03_00760 [Proteobacteria bacterium]|nr:hypothetical protein [Pseudomonadota bacterium]
MYSKPSAPWYPAPEYANDNAYLECDWNSVRGQLMEQWTLLSQKDLEAAGPNRYAIAELVERVYGISHELIENYLSNLERTLPLHGGLHVC